MGKAIKITAKKAPEPYDLGASKFFRTPTVPLGEDCDRLMFWLNCGPEDNGSHTYAIYDITLNK